MQKKNIKLYVVVFLSLIPKDHLFLWTLDRNSPLNE